MTRDTQGLHDDRDPENDADVYGALWMAAPFPRLPIDAPNELKNLTIDIDDPKRVYAIHHASRRHNFNILVERSIRPYILSLLFSLLTSFIDISFSFDTVASLKHVLHQHASPVGNDLLGAHQFAATM